jgi:hypothetical protein
MPLPPPRPAAQRKADALAKLAEQGADVWVASSDADPYLVPLSLAWVSGRVVLAVQAASRTARNITASGTARLGLGPTRDVVIIDAVLDAVHDLADAPAPIIAAYVTQADWDPRSAGTGYLLLVLRPQRLQAWRESNELAGRTLMRDGVWLS